MEDVAGLSKALLSNNLLERKGLTLQQLFPYTSSYPFKNLDCHKISFFNDGVLKRGHFGIFDMRLFISGIR